MLDETDDGSVSESGLDDNGDDSLASNLDTDSSTTPSAVCPSSEVDSVSAGVAGPSEELDAPVCESRSSDGLEASIEMPPSDADPVDSTDDSISRIKAANSTTKMVLGDSAVMSCWWY